MSQTCPHCYGRVIPLRGNECPSCGKRVDDATGADRTRTLMTLREGERLPPTCIACGTATVRTVAIQRRRADERGSDSVVIALVLGAFFHLAGILALLLRKRPGVRIDLAIPQCPACAALHGKPDAEHISWGTHEMTFVVAKTFRRAVRQVRGMD